MTEISQNTKKLIQRYQDWHQSRQKKEGVLTIHVDEVASAVAGFYEKIREVVDWREEHLMKRAAIERILKRRLLFKNGNPIAEPLILELIRGGYFPNDKIPESKIAEIQKIIDKYTFIIENSPKAPKEKQEIYLFDWILGVAACEIEEALSPFARETALIDYMTEAMLERIKIKNETQISEEEKNVQIFIGVQRALLKADHPFIAYNLFKKKYPGWQNFSINEPRLTQMAQNIYSLWQNIETGFEHSLSGKFYRICERYDTSYLILGDIISENPMEVFKTIGAPAELESRIKSFYQKRLSTLKVRIKRAAIYATLSIFITKILLVLALEIPFDKYVTKQFDPFALGLNILIPPALMFFLILTIRTPKDQNMQRVVMETMKIVYAKEEKDVYVVGLPKKRGAFMNFAVTLSYFLTFFLSFGIIIWGLSKLNFGVLSIVIFLVFVSLISFAGTKIKERAKELEIGEEKGPPLMIFFDIISLPIIQLGKWLSRQWTRYNIVVVFFNFLIDLPLQSFIEFLEQWRIFLKEKKEEIK